MKNYKHEAIILFFLFFKAALFSQGIHIEGLVISEDSSPVPYATMYDGSQKSGTFSDSLGRYSITMPDNVKELHISAIGYKSKTITVGPSDNLSDFHIVLQNDTFKLKEVVISSKTFKPKRIELGPRKKIKGHTGLGFVSFIHETGLYIPNPEQTRGEIKSVEVYLNRRNTDNKHLIRLRIYSVDENLYPAEDLLLDNIPLEVKNSKRDQLIKINLEKYHISIPSNGIIVALECIQDNQELNLSNFDIPNNRESIFMILFVDDNTNQFVQWARIDKGNWYTVNDTSLYKQHGFEVTNLVPYFKLTINEYADQK